MVSTRQKSHNERSTSKDIAQKKRNTNESKKQDTSKHDSKEKENKEKVKQHGTSWTSLQDVEAKIKALQIQQDKARDEKTRKKIGKLLDQYEKQAKQLIITEAERKVQEAGHSEGGLGKIIEVDETEENEEQTTISDETARTTNSKVTERNT